MILDLHCHTKYSYDNHLEPEDLIARALELKLDGVCFTEHHSANASEPVSRIACPVGFTVLRGGRIGRKKEIAANGRK